jgi:hypothetical protein
MRTLSPAGVTYRFATRCRRSENGAAVGWFGRRAAELEMPRHWPQHGRCGVAAAAAANREARMLRILIRAGLFGVCIAALMSSPAAAFKKVNLPGTRTKEYMKDLCDTAHGQYVEGQGQYGCITNCGQQGMTSDACGINCSEKTSQCYGWTPSRGRPPRTPAAILNPPPRALKAR